MKLSILDELYRPNRSLGWHPIKLSLLQLFFMGKFYASIADHHKEFIESQHLFFVSTAPLDS